MQRIKALRNRIKALNQRWAIVDKMFVSAFVTGMMIELSQVGAGFVDGLVIGHFFGAESMAAYGIAHPIFSVLGVISGLIAVGMQVKSSQSIGHGDIKKFNEYFSISTFFAVVVSVVITFLLIVFARPLTAFLGASGKAENLMNSSAMYLIGVAIGTPALILVAVLSPAIQLDSGHKVVQTGAIINVVADVLFDLLAVKLNMGIFGVGLAAAISGYLNLLYLCIHFLKHQRMLHFVYPKISFKEFFAMLLNGSEKAIRRLTNIIRPILLNRIIVFYGGVLSLSALSVQNNITGFAEIAASGIAEAVALVTGIFYGEINKEAIREIKLCKYFAVFVTSSIICLVLFLFAKPIAYLYVTEEGKLFDMVVFALKMLGIQILIKPIIMCRIKYLQVVQQKKNMNLLIFSSQLVFVLLSAFILGKLLGVYGILSCFVFSDSLSLFAVYIFYCVKCRKLFPHLDDYLNLPDKFHLKPEDYISLDIINSDDAVLASEQISLFCKGHGIDPKIGYYFALACEELTVNVVSYGFENTKAKNPMIDLRFVKTDNELVLRLQDNCPQFNIMKKIQEVNEKYADTTCDIGIRVLSKIAEDIQYVHLMNTNAILIRYPL